MASFGILCTMPGVDAHILPASAVAFSAAPVIWGDVTPAGAQQGAHGALAWQPAGGNVNDGRLQMLQLSSLAGHLASQQQQHAHMQARALSPFT